MNLSNLRTSNKNSILDKTLTKGKNEVSLSLFALVFSEIVQYSQKSSSSVADLAEKLHSLGYDVGSRLLDLYVFREKNSKRETKLINMLLFIKTTLWKVKKPNRMLDWANIIFFFVRFLDSLWEGN
jgi:trafficking protein particle complex subunit 5